MELKAKNNLGRYLPITSLGVKGGSGSDLDYSGQNYLHARVIDITKSINTKTGYSITLPGTLGTLGKTHLETYGEVLNSTSTGTGSKGDTSVSITSTALTKEVEFVYGKKYSDYENYLSNGDYAIDYATGVIIYKTADTSTTATITYSYLIPKVDTELTATNLTIDNIKVYSTDNTITNLAYAKITSSQIPYAYLTNSDGSQSPVDATTGYLKVEEQANLDLKYNTYSEVHSGMGNGTYDYDFLMDGYRSFSIQGINTKGSGSNVYTFLGSNDGTTNWTDLTSNLFSVANVTDADFVWNDDTTYPMKYGRIEIVRSGDTLVDGGWTLNIRRVW